MQGVLETMAALVDESDWLVCSLSGSVSPAAQPSSEQSLEAAAAVLSKLRKHPQFKKGSYTEEQLMEEVEALADANKMKEKYFQVLLDADSDVIEDAMEEAMGLSGEEKDEFTSLDFAKATERAEDRFKLICSLPVKLQFTKVGEGGKKRKWFAGLAGGRTGATFASILQCEFGAMHASLDVGGIIIEWDDSSLIIPHCDGGNPVFCTDLQQHSYWRQFVLRLKPRMSQTVVKTMQRRLDFSEQVDVMVSVKKEKEEIIDNLISEIVRYNGKECYSLRHCNCQHFIKDAMKAVRVFEVPQFSGKLDEYFQCLKRGEQHKATKEYRTHEDLDEYVRSSLSHLKQESMEYLLMLYYNFHAQDGMKDASKWSCRKQDCQMLTLDKHLDKQRLLLYKFT